MFKRKKNCLEEPKSLWTKNREVIWPAYIFIGSLSHFIHNRLKEGKCGTEKLFIILKRNDSALGHVRKSVSGEKGVGSG